MGDRFDMSQASGRILAGLQPLIDRAFGVASSRQVMGEQFRLALDKIGEMLFQRRRDARVQFLPSPAQKCRVGGVLHQRVLEGVSRIGRCTTSEYQACRCKLFERIIKLLTRERRDCD